MESHKGKFCPYQKMTTCQENSCDVCAIYDNLSGIFPIKLVTNYKCLNCGKSGDVVDCKKEERRELILGSYESYIADLCPICSHEVEYI
jgi:hypothetical protein